VPPVEQLRSRAESLVAEFKQGGGTSCIDEAIDVDREALELCPPGHPMRSVSLNGLALHLGNRYDRLGATRDLEEAIVLDREALNLRPQGHPDRRVSLGHIALHLTTRYNQFGVMEDLDEALLLARQALDLCPQGHPDRLVSLGNLALHLTTRYNQLGVMEDLDEALLLARQALDLCPQGHPDRGISLINLAQHLWTRYKQLGVMEDLDEATVLDREALNLFPPGHPLRSISSRNLALHLWTRYKQLGAMEDLDEGILLAREALDPFLQGHPHRSMSLNNLAAYLSTRYDKLGAMEDLDEAIVLVREALNLRPQGHPDRGMSLINLAQHLWTRYKQLGAMENVDEAIVLARDALDLSPQGHPLRSMSLNNLAACLSTRYDKLGAMEDLDEAIVLVREAFNLRSQGHPERGMCLSNLALHLWTRYEQLGAIEDLEEAILLARQALNLCSQGHPDRGMSLNNLAGYLCTLYDKLRAMEDLDEAIVLVREALHLRPQGHPDRSMSLSNLAAYLCTRYGQLRAMDDLYEAIVLDREALHLFSQGHPLRSMSLNNLASHLFTRYEQLGAMEDLDEAILLARKALDLCPQGHRDRSVSLDSLARYLGSQFTRSKQLQDKEEIFSLFAQLVNVPQLVSSKDLSAARSWARVAEDFQHHTILLAYETSFRLLSQHLATLPSLPRHLVILKSLTSSLAVDAFSACLRKGAPARAVELLEQGRGVFWGQLSRLHSPLDDVIGSSPAGKTLADEFARLALLIRNALNSPSAGQHERVCHLNLELQKVVTNIRSLRGLSRFLLPSLFPDLRLAASGGPVIIVNASKYSCDALIVFLDRDPVHIPLQITQEGVRELSTEFHTLTVRATRGDVTKGLAFFLRTLWDQVVSPIVHFLQTTHPSQSRIWWCPTAEFSVLPLHAAGPYRKGEQNLPHIYISSYTPTLTALIRARRHDPSNSANEQKRFIAIGQANAAGERELPSVGAELDIIGQRVDGLATFTRIDGEESRISRVVDELSRNEWVHLACHGLPNRKQPFESAFALHDGHFTIQHIIGCDVKNPEFAYLSACHTTVGDEESPDEVIHLASAMQFVGFRSVIGTMWAVDDGETNKITSTFYKHMVPVDECGRLDHTRAAFALNKTMKSVHVPLDQRILYIHLGA
jgi:CHAT domain-containing protein/tetratricopeptide (TPR) repeat protein